MCKGLLFLLVVVGSTICIEREFLGYLKEIFDNFKHYWFPHKKKSATVSETEYSNILELCDLSLENNSSLSDCGPGQQTGRLLSIVSHTLISR